MRYLLLLLTLCTADAATIIARRGAAPPAAFPTSSLVHYWRMEEGYAAAGAYDAVGSADLTPVNTPTAAATGKLGYCRDFVSASDMSFTGSTIWSSGSFTFSSWVYLDDTSGTHAILSQGAGGNYAFRLLYGVGIADFRFGVTTNGSTATEVDTVGIAPTTGVWYHVACGYDATAQEIWIEVDGGTRYTASFTGTIWGSATSFDIGIMQSTAATDMEGRIDDVGYWSASLSESDVEAIYGTDISGAGRRYDYAVPTSNLVSYYTLDETSGNAADSHGANTMTETGTVPNDASGILGSARSFGNASNYLGNASMLGGSGVTVSMWVKQDGTPTNHYFYELGENATNYAVRARLVDTAGDIEQSYITIDSGGSADFFPSSVQATPIADNTWTHIVYTCPAGGSTQRVYRNGVMDHTSLYTTVTGLKLVAGFYLGKVGSGALASCSLDEVAAYSVALDPGQIAELYGSGTPPAY